MRVSELSSPDTRPQGLACYPLSIEFAFPSIFVSSLSFCIYCGIVERFRLSTNSTLTVSDSDPSFTSKSRGQGISAKRGACFMAHLTSISAPTWEFAVAILRYQSKPSSLKERIFKNDYCMQPSYIFPITPQIQNAKFVPVSASSLQWLNVNALWNQIFCSLLILHEYLQPLLIRLTY